MQQPSSALSQGSKKHKQEFPEVPVVFTADAIPDYFPTAFEHTLGPLPIPLHQESYKRTFPNNVSFYCSDWTTSDAPEEVEAYDVVVA